MGYLCLSNMAASRIAARLLSCKGSFLRSTGNSAAAYQVQSLFKRSFMSTGTNTVISKGFCRIQGVANAFLSKSNHQVMPTAQLTLNTQSTTFSTLQNQIKAKGVLPPKVGSFASGVRCLPTLNQIRRQKPRSKNTQPKPYIPKSERVLLGPQRKGVCIKVFIRKPKKPNSAQRKCALLKLSNGKTISAYIPHEKGQLQEHGVVLFEGGRVQDCPGIKYKIIRGKLDMN